MLVCGAAVKVSDFGHAEDIYSEACLWCYVDCGLSDRLAAFTVTTEVSWRWAAMEVLRDKIFTGSSDVWSFGTTCWEVFSLGATPYPHIGLQRLLVGSCR